MKEGFKQLPEIDGDHNLVHRLSFMQPETTYVTTREPTVDTLKMGESRVYHDGSNYWLYTKLGKNKIGKIQYSL